jgi:hypothetical protein
MVDMEMEPVDLVNKDSKKRNRTILGFKKEVVEKFYIFAELRNQMRCGNTQSKSNETKFNIKSQDLGDDAETSGEDCNQSFSDGEEDETVVMFPGRKKKDRQDNEIDQRTKDVTAFVVSHNSVEGNMQIDEKSMYKWLKADQRFEFEDWYGKNDLQKPNCKSKMVIEEINIALEMDNPDASQFQEVVKSRHSPDSYGVIARKNIEPGEVLGFFKGEFVENKPEGPRQKSYGLMDPNSFKPGMVEIGHIDGSAYDSCYGRYYVCAAEPAFQNVLVDRVNPPLDCDRTVYFYANKPIKEGDELLIPMDQDYPRHRSKRVRIDFSRYRAVAAEGAARFGN